MRHAVAAQVAQPDDVRLIRAVHLEFNDDGDLVVVSTERAPGEAPGSVRAADLIDAIAGRLRKGQRIEQQLVALGQMRDVLAELAMLERRHGAAARETARAMRRNKPAQAA